LAFIEFLLNSGLAVPTVKNNVTSVKSCFKSNGISVEVFSSHQLSLALASLTTNYTPPLAFKPIFSPHQFVQLIHSTSLLPFHILYKMAFY
jgi:hypothetical protein